MTPVKGNLGPDLPVLERTKVYANDSGRCDLRRVVLGERRSHEVNRVGGGPKGTSEHLPDRFLCAEHSENGGKGSKYLEAITSCHIPCLVLDLSQKEQGGRASGIRVD